MCDKVILKAELMVDQKNTAMRARRDAFCWRAKFTGVVVLDENTLFIPVHPSVQPMMAFPSYRYQIPTSPSHR